MGKRYSVHEPSLDCRPEQEYQAWLVEVLNESARVLMPGGTLYLYHLPIWSMRVGAILESRLQFRHWVAIAMKNGFVRGQRLYPAHYSLLMFTRGSPAFFCRPKLDPARCRHCGEYIKDYGGYRPIIDANGINLSDIWDDLSPVRHRKHKYRDANELPTALFERIVEISGAAGELYVDPFAGSGSGVLAAVQAKMHFKCCDLLLDNCRIICERLDTRRT
ncbi:MAG: hypothetical protein KJ000_13260 [Pirellulaceae bacterium]|nr:hypothetical protein [Pirellulaceae bacterium]